VDGGEWLAWALKAGRICVMDGKGTSSGLAAVYTGRRFWQRRRCVLLLVNHTLSFLFSPALLSFSTIFLTCSKPLAV